MKKVISICLALVFTLCLAVPAFASGKDVTLHYICGKQDAGSTFHYDDDLFDQDPYQFHKDLCLMTFGLTWCSGSSKDARNAKDLSTENRNFLEFARLCGFRDAQSNEWFGKIPDRQSMGVSFARRKIKGYTVIAMGIRGSGYRAEWGSNMDVGLSGEHVGFRKSADIVLRDLRNYITSHNITGPVKIWTGGYSRGAAVCNMVCGALDDGYNLGEKVEFNPKQLFVYTYETPMGTTKQKAADKKYNNIHNIINPADAVCYMGPQQWGFARYGVDHLLPGVSTGTNMADELKKVPNDCDNINWPDYFISTRGDTMASFIPKLMDLLTGTFVTSREDYVKNVGDYISAALVDWNSLEDKDTDQILANFAAKVQKNSGSIFQALVRMDSTVAGTLADMLIDSLQENGITTYDAAGVRKAFQEITPRLFRMAAKDPYVTSTALANLLGMFHTHAGGICQAWLDVLPEEQLRSNISYSYQA